jgi:hypothetical protein
VTVYCDHCMNRIEVQLQLFGEEAVWFHVHNCSTRCRPLDADSPEATPVMRAGHPLEKAA